MEAQVSNKLSLLFGTYWKVGRKNRGNEWLQ